MKAREATGLPIVSELMDEAHIDEFEEYVDIVQIGARNMQNFQLLKAVGKMHKPILLKRGLANTIEEWIMSAEYIMAGGNENVILCERGIRTFERATRNTLDLSAVPVVKEKRPTCPSSWTPAMPPATTSTSRAWHMAAVAAGADGLEIEVHDNPQCAWSDGAQCLKPDKFAETIANVPQGGRRHRPGDVSRGRPPARQPAWAAQATVPPSKSAAHRAVLVRGAGRRGQPHHQY